MPTSKEDAVANAEARDQPVYTEFCALLDRIIAIKTGTGQPVIVSTETTPDHIVDRIEETYTQLGWNVERIDSEQDGLQIKLT